MPHASRVLKGKNYAAVRHEAEDKILSVFYPDNTEAKDAIKARCPEAFQRLQRLHETLDAGGHLYNQKMKQGVRQASHEAAWIVAAYTVKLACEGTPYSAIPEAFPDTRADQKLLKGLGAMPADGVQSNLARMLYSIREKLSIAQDNTV